MSQIICLANSQKHGNRCIAGIEISTGKWVRPVSNLDDGRVSKEVYLIDGQEPKLLDILEIPLAETGPGHECENRLILPGQWKHIGKASVSDLVKYCEDNILYSQWLNSLPFSFLEKLPPENRRTLQLIRTSSLNLKYYENRHKWEGYLTTVNGQKIRGKVTDLVFINRLKIDVNISHECLVTISLTQPWSPNPSDELACWKIIAAIIELSKIDLILFEMKRIGWTKIDGRSYLQKTYNKQTRQELTPREITDFLNYLKSLST